jgi:predicted nucleic acid-binding protein
VLLEQGSELAVELWEISSPVASSLLAYPEGRAALAAARRSNRLTPRLAGKAVAEFGQIGEQLIAIGVDEKLTRMAGDLASELDLRGYDAVHLATALSLGEHDVAFVSWDRGLCRAANEAGLTVISRSYVKNTSENQRVPGDIDLEIQGETATT